MSRNTPSPLNVDVQRPCRKISWSRADDVAGSVDAVTIYFTLSQGQASIRTDLAIWTILNQCLQKISAVFHLPDKDGVLSSSSTVQRLLQAIFDTQIQGFLSQDSSVILSQLDRTTRAQILAQAIAGFVSVFRRLAKAGLGVTSAVFNRETQRFAESEERRALMMAIEGSNLFNNCYTESQISDLIVHAIEERERNRIILNEETEQLVSWATELPDRDMGLPCGFTILPVN
jgi:hypothetical protein